MGRRREGQEEWNIEENESGNRRYLISLAFQAGKAKNVSHS